MKDKQIVFFIVCVAFSYNFAMQADNRLMRRENEQLQVVRVFPEEGENFNERDFVFEEDSESEEELSNDSSDSEFELCSREGDFDLHFLELPLFKQCLKRAACTFGVFCTMVCVPIGINKLIEKKE